VPVLTLLRYSVQSVSAWENSPQIVWPNLFIVSRQYSVRKMRSEGVKKKGHTR
jgi:hypothetical protein